MAKTKTPFLDYLSSIVKNRFDDEKLSKNELKERTEEFIDGLDKEDLIDLSNSLINEKYTKTCSK